MAVVLIAVDFGRCFERGSGGGCQKRLLVDTLWLEPGESSMKGSLGTHVRQPMENGLWHSNHVGCGLCKMKFFEGFKLLMVRGVGIRQFFSDNRSQRRIYYAFCMSAGMVEVENFKFVFGEEFQFDRMECRVQRCNKN